MCGLWALGETINADSINYPTTDAGNNVACNGKFTSGRSKGIEPMSGIFISYRRSDIGAYAAGRLYDALAQRFGADHVFMDIDSLKGLAGLDFGRALEQAVTTCDVMIALIGPEWITATDGAEMRRLEDSDDWVRQEIATALARSDIRVIPVLMGEASMPKTEELPDDLKALARRQKYEISDSRWSYDVNELIDNVLAPLIGKPVRRFSRRMMALAAAGVAAGGSTVTAVVWAINDNRKNDDPSPPSPTPHPTEGPTSTEPTSTQEVSGEPTDTGLSFGEVPHPIFADQLVSDEDTSAWEDIGPRSATGVVLHRMEGTLQATDDDYRSGSNVNLMDYGVDHESGDIVRWNDPSGAPHAEDGVSANRTPHALSKIQNPSGDALGFLNDVGAATGDQVSVSNRDQISISISGELTDSVGDSCKEAVAALIAYFADLDQVPWDTFPKIPGKAYGFVRLHNQFDHESTCPGDIVGDATEDIIDQARDIMRSYQVFEPESAQLVFDRVRHPPFEDRPVAKPEGQGQDDLGTREMKGVVLHRMSAELRPTDSFMHEPAMMGLFDYGVGTEGIDGTEDDGVILRWNDPERRQSGWANGPWDNPPGNGRAFVETYGLDAINRDLVSISISGDYESPISEKAIEAVAKLCAYWADHTGIPWDTYPQNPATNLIFVYWHNEFAGSKPCPGSVVMDATPEIQARTSEILKSLKIVPG